MNKSVLTKMYSSTGKVELSEVKVDLALVDDINKMLATVIAERDANMKLADGISDLDKRIKAADVTITQKQKEFEDLKNNLGKGLAKEATSVETNMDKQMAKSDKLENTSIALINKAKAAAEGLGVAPSAIKNLTELENATGDLEGWKMQIKSNYDKMEYPEFLKF